MTQQLSWLVDDSFTLLDLENCCLLGSLMAPWYAHACCSAGSDDQTSYQGPVDAGSTVAQTLAAGAALGTRVAPLPRLLLGAEKPLRGFIGRTCPVSG